MVSALSEGRDRGRRQNPRKAARFLFRQVGTGLNKLPVANTKPIGQRTVRHDKAL